MNSAFRITNVSMQCVLWFCSREVKAIFINNRDDA